MNSEGKNGNPLQYSGLENPMDRGAWQAAVPGVARVGHDWVTKQQEDSRETRHDWLDSPGFFHRVHQCSMPKPFQTVCDPMDCSPPGFSVLGILQAKILEWIACSPLGNLPSPSIVFVSLMSYELQADSLLLNHQGNPKLNSNGPFS